jgi:hypothetical protein
MWFYNFNNTSAGPVDEAGVKSLIASGTIQPTTLVWREGMPGWQAAGSTELGSLFGTLPPQPYYMPQTSRVLRSSFKSLFVWWVVTNAFYLGYLAVSLISFSLIGQYNLTATIVLQISMFVLYIPIITSAVLEYILLYKLWKIVQDGFASTTPGKAVGFMFIPFFNYYWFFRAYWGLAKDENRFIDRHFAGEPGLQVRKSKPWLALTYLIYAIGGGIICAVVMMGIMFSTIFSMSASGSFSQMQSLTMMQPVMIVEIVYIAINWALCTMVLIDLSLTGDSILKAEETLANPIKITAGA